MWTCLSAIYARGADMTLRHSRQIHNAKAFVQVLYVLDYALVLNG